MTVYLVIKSKTRLVIFLHFHSFLHVKSHIFLLWSSTEEGNRYFALLLKNYFSNMVGLWHCEISSGVFTCRLSQTGAPTSEFGTKKQFGTHSSDKTIWSCKVSCILTVATFFNVPKLFQHERCIFISSFLRFVFPWQLSC